MTGEQWRGVTNVVLYSVQFDRELGDPVAAQDGAVLARKHAVGLTPQAAYDALAQASRSAAPLTGDIPQSHSDQEFREFLRRLLGRLDTLRPWPDLPYRRLDASRWADFAAARPIGRIGMGYVRAQERLRRIFDRLDDGNSREVLLLRLRSGDEVALVGAPQAAEVTVLQRASDRPAAQVLAEFVNATGFTADEVTPLR